MLGLFGGKSPSVYVVLATTSSQSFEWTANLTIPNLKIVPYIADDKNATFHPDENKGNEAMMYLTYFFDFYDDLPDISIFTHGQNDAWHVEEILNGSTLYALNMLDLDEVLERKYVNLRVSWDNACPNWINTTINENSPEYNPDLKSEEPFMKMSFEQLFPNTTVPEILSQPCCSQFAVTKEVIRAVPRERYQAWIAWLQETWLPNEISGRVWEHLWQYIFLEKAVDCPDERKALCSTYHICFETEEDWEDWKNLGRSKADFNGNKSLELENGISPGAQVILEVDQKIEDLTGKMFPLKQKAIKLGSSEKVRRQLTSKD
jgi:hypothetical protein